MTGELLSTATAAGYLADRGLCSPGQPVTVTELGGGVSNVVLLAVTQSDRMVIKQSLPQLKVAHTWTATTERTVHEGHALKLIGARWPDEVPAVRDLDVERQILVIDGADPTWSDWKESLLAGRIQPTLGAVMGTRLARWQSSIPASDIVAAGLDDPDTFDQLRIDPYYRATAVALPQWTDTLNEHAADLRVATCLVHGDFSPKNVLVGKRGCWNIDFEVAQLGNPVFDVAFMLTHLLLKALHLPQQRDAFLATADHFLSAYSAELGSPIFTEQQLAGQVGCLLLARIAGKSPVEYLDPGQRQTTRQIAELLLTGTVPTVPELWPHPAFPRSESAPPEGERP